MIKSIIVILFIILFISHKLIAKDISHDESYNLYQSGALIIDVRNKSEWKETGIIPKSKLVPMLTHARTLRNDFIDNLISTIGEDKSIKVGIICRSGGRSSATVSMLKDKGYKNIYNMSEGLVGDGEKTGWISRGYPIIGCGNKCK